MITDEQAVALVRDGILRVDPDGTVWRLKTRSRTGRVRPIDPVRADFQERNGYHLVRIGRQGMITVHRLVWLVQQGPIAAGLEVNHKNLNKSDNRIENLELLTHAANVQHAFANGAVPALRGESNGQSKLTETQVVEIRAAAQRGESKRALARRYSVTPTLIRHIVTGRAWKHAAFPEVCRG